MEELSKLSDSFNEENDIYLQSLVRKFNKDHNIVGADIYEMQHLLIVNQKFIRKLIMIAKKHPHSLLQLTTHVVMIHHAQTFFNQFYHSDGRVRRVLKAALKSIVTEDERVHKWRDDVEVLKDLSHNSNFFHSLDRISKLTIAHW